ncbi:hypothetical protein BGZ73_003167 [Actinomortierella ambigua]|nr:hypothetical protein BGZ73_003167 [Actinomortierella ambigua]
MKSTLPLPSNPSHGEEFFSNSNVHPRRAAKLLTDRDRDVDTMIIALFEWDPDTHEWRHQTGDVFEHEWTGDWNSWDRQYHLLFSRDASILYVATRDDDVLYALDANNHLRVLAKVDLPFRAKCYTLSMTRVDNIDDDDDEVDPVHHSHTPSSYALYITSVCPWFVAVYEPVTLRHLGNVSSGRCDLSYLNNRDEDDNKDDSEEDSEGEDKDNGGDEDKDKDDDKDEDDEEEEDEDDDDDDDNNDYDKEYLAILNPSTAIVHRTVRLEVVDRDAVVIDTPVRHCVSHPRICRLSRHVDVIYSSDCGEYPWLLDLVTLRRVRLDLFDGDGAYPQVVERKKRIEFVTMGRPYIVPWGRMMQCLDDEGHVAVDAPSSITIYPL